MTNITVKDLDKLCTKENVAFLRYLLEMSGKAEIILKLRRGDDSIRIFLED